MSDKIPKELFVTFKSQDEKDWETGVVTKLTRLGFAHPYEPTTKGEIHGMLVWHTGKILRYV